jgi:hypothetical protein
MLDELKVESDATVTCGYKGAFYLVPVDQNPRAAKARAIWAYGTEKK